MLQRGIGNVLVSAVGMGAMTITQQIDADRDRGIRTVHAALDAGVTLFDTADSYGPSGEMGINELALADALRSHSGSLDDVIIATKGGHTRGPNATWWVDGTPEHLAKAARDSARRLGLESLPLYQLHRPDVRVPFEDSVGALKQLVDDGVAVRVGVSNVDEEQLRTALGIVGSALVSVQNEYSPTARESHCVLRMCEDHGLAFLAWGPFGGMRAAKNVGGSAPAFQQVAERHGVSVQRVVLAWLLALSPKLIPVPGASRPESVLDSIAATTLTLDDQELAELAQSADHKEGENR